MSHRPAAARSAQARLLPLAVGGWVLASVAVGTWATYYAAHRQDQYQLLQLGRCVLDGGRLYADAWENKPPGVAWINALGLALSGGRMWSAWLLPGVAAVLGLGLFGLATGRVLRPTAGAMATCLAAVVLSLRLYDSPSINPDFYASVFGLAAFSLWLIAVVDESTGRRLPKAVAAGLLWACAVTTKQTGAAGLLALTVVTLAYVGLRREARRIGLSSIAAAWVGFLVGIGCVVFMLHRQETLALAWEAIFTFNRSLADPTHVWATVRDGTHLAAALAPLQLPLVLAAVGLLATCAGGTVNRLSPATAWALLAWWVIQVLLATMGPSGSMRYWQATFPPMLFLAAIGLHYLVDAFGQLRGGHRVAVTVAGLTMVVALGRPLGEHFVYGVAHSHLDASYERTERDELETIGDKVKSVTPTDKPIYVFAYDTGVYLYADRRAASRFNYPRSKAQMAEIVSDLAESDAAALLLPASMPPLFTRWCDEECQLNIKRLMSRYAAHTTAGRYTVWTPRHVEYPTRRIAGHQG